MSHTPGPWRLYKGKLRPQFPTEILEVQGPRGKVIVQWMGFDGSNCSKQKKIANARLIAQAWTIPALRAALEGLLADTLEVLGQFDVDPTDPLSEQASIKAARAALALANEPADGDQS